MIVVSASLFYQFFQTSFHPVNFLILFVAIFSASYGILSLLGKVNIHSKKNSPTLTGFIYGFATAFLLVVFINHFMYQKRSAELRQAEMLQQTKNPAE
jgi:hypothetical protein